MSPESPREPSSVLALNSARHLKPSSLMAASVSVAVDDNIQLPYTDTPTSPQSAMSLPLPDASPTIKPVTAPSPTLENDNEDQDENENELPYRDDPSSPPQPLTHQPSRAPLSMLPPRYHHHRQLRHHHVPYQPYTDLASPSEVSSPTSPHDDDDVPLAQLLLHPRAHAQPPAYLHPQMYPFDAAYPVDAPPSYYVAIRQPHHDTLIQRINLHHPFLGGADEEAGLDADGTDDMRYLMGRVIAMFTAALVLLVISAVLGWLALGNAIWT